MVDYSKWNNIEVSDDEDETHPNIDTRSLFKWRHEARVQRMDDFEKKEKDNQEKIAENKKKMDTVTANIAKLKTSENEEKIKSLKTSLETLKTEAGTLQQEKTFLEKEKAAQPHNVDTLSQPGFNKTIINADKPKKSDLSEEEQMERSKVFMKDYKEDIKKYGMMKEYHDSETFLSKNTHLACEDTANYLVVWCIDLEVEEKHALMERVAHQTICMQFLLELSKQLEMDPRSCIKGFFNKMRKNDDEYMRGFKDELTAFIGRVKGRAEARIEKAMREYEEEEKQKRLGPGGLDPVEVMETLPQELQHCFESKDIAMLQSVMGSMPEEEARYHLKRCIDSGLWVPGGGAEGTEETTTEEEEHYEPVE